MEFLSQLQKTTHLFNEPPAGDMAPIALQAPLGPAAAEIAGVESVDKVPSIRSVLVGGRLKVGGLFHCSRGSRCLLVALNGHADCTQGCPLLGVERK